MISNIYARDNDVIFCYSRGGAGRDMTIDVFLLLHRLLAALQHATSYQELQIFIQRDKIGT